MGSRLIRTLAILAFAAAVCGCATTSAASRIERRLIGLGVSERGAACLASNLRGDLNRRQLAGVADFLDRVDRLDRTGRPGAVIDALMRIDDPDVVAAVAAAGISCALRS